MCLKQTHRPPLRPSSPLLHRNCTSCPRRGRTSLWSLATKGAPLQGATVGRMRAPRGLLCLRRPGPPPSSPPPVPRRQEGSCVTPTAKMVRREGQCEGRHQRTGPSLPFQLSDHDSLFMQLTLTALLLCVQPWARVHSAGHSIAQ